MTRRHAGPFGRMESRTRPLPGAIAWKCLVLVLNWGCLSCTGTIDDIDTLESSRASDTGQPHQTMALRAPPREGFQFVADALQPSCGTLDCHGRYERNLRLFGSRGLRIGEGLTSGSGDTTDTEYDASYWSVVGLEPEELGAVVRDGGARVERLSLIRKARDTEKHKGGSLMTAGDKLDRCIVDWLAGHVNQLSCEAITDEERPQPKL